MSEPIAYPSDLALYLNVTNIDTTRAAAALLDAQTACETVLSPLPPSAAYIVKRIAARAFTNPTDAQSQAIGSAHVTYGAAGGSVGFGGIYLSRADKADLRRIAGRGGAFAIDPTPATAGQGLQPWDQNVTWLNGVPIAEDQSFGGNP